jgi:hypothetical protein
MMKIVPYQLLTRFHFQRTKLCDDARDWLLDGAPLRGLWQLLLPVDAVQEATWTILDMLEPILL